MVKRKPSETQNEVQRKKGRKNAEESSDDDSEIAGPSTQRISQRVSQRFDINARSGKILAVKLRNFMCHQNLSVDLNRRTNLLIGQNGSGKSAVLTALIIGLGSKANATNRSTNIKQLIRNGESSATIEVHLSNDGADAYEHSKYGNRIVVVRQITASGASSYKLKSAMGNIISTSRADLLKLIMYMNIQVDNPVCVMTQDASRGFLRDSDPKKRYELFLKATQLDVTIEKLNCCVTQLNTAKTKLHAEQKLSQKLKEIKEKAEEKLKQFQSMEPLKKEIKRHKIEQAWLVVKNQEEFLESINSTLDDTRKKSEDASTRLRNISTNEQEMTEKRAEIDGNITSLSQQLATVQATHTEEKNYFRVQNERFLQQQGALKKLSAKQTNIKTTIRKLNEHIAEEMTTNKNHIEELKQANEEKLAEKQEQKTDMEASITNHRREIGQFSSALQKYMSQFDERNGMRHKYTEEKKHIEKQLNQINASPSEYLPNFGNHFPKLVNRIEQLYKNGKFLQKPLGPMGNYIEVSNAKYRQFVEDSLVKFLHSFCVDNQDDSKTLRALIEKEFPPLVSLTIITSKFTNKVFDVSNKSVQADSKSVRLMDLIIVENPNVMNCLIDMHSIETILLTNDFHHATKITSKRENVPNNLTHVILTEPYTLFYPAPSYRSYTFTRKTAPLRLLRINGADREKELRNDLEKNQENLVKMGNELKELNARINENKKVLQDRKSTVDKLEPKLRRLDIEINELESVEYPQENDISVMQNEVAEQTKQLERATEAYEKEETELNAFKQTIAELDERLKELNQNIRSIKQQIDQQQKSKDDIAEKLQKRESEQTHFQAKINKFEDIIDKLVKEQKEAMEKLHRLDATAKKAGNRVEVKHTEQQLLALIKSNERKITIVSTSNESIESVQESYKKAQNDLKNSENLVAILTHALKSLNNSLKIRFKNVSRLKEYMKTRISNMFFDVMQLRDCDGKITFDEDKRMLDIKVVPRDKHCDNAVSKTTNLSGGERSFTTVAFLMALWTCVDHPFYFLDEYDVFTDAINRKYLTTILLNEAEKKEQYQYTFLTPQDTSDIHSSDILSILRLDNPNR